MALRQRRRRADERGVTTLVRSLRSSVQIARSARRALAAVAGLSALLGVLLSAAAAQALVTSSEVGAVGVAPRVSESYEAGAAPKTFANPDGHPVLHGMNEYVIYWDPDDEYWESWQQAIDHYFQAAGVSSGLLSTVFAVDSQYSDRSNRPAAYSQTFEGAYPWYHAYPASGCSDPEPLSAQDQIPLEYGGTPTPVCLTSAQVATALEYFIAEHSLPKGMGDVYYLLTPPGVTVCLDGGTVSGHCSDYLAGSKQSYDNSFCSYHAAINPGGSAEGGPESILYAVIPWTAGGYGDTHLAFGDRRAAWECDQGNVAETARGGYRVVNEVTLSAQQQHEFDEAGLEEKEETEESIAGSGPHVQEPNQAKCPETIWVPGDCAYGLSDVIVNQISVEQQDLITDPLLNAWQDEHHYESADECRFYFGPKIGGDYGTEPLSYAGTLSNQELAGSLYELNDAFDLASERLPYPDVPCVTGVTLDPHFTAPNVVNAGETVGFDGKESEVTLDAAIRYSSAGEPISSYATYTWNFGDGTPLVSGYAPGSPQCETPWLSPCAAGEFHTYKYGGTYMVTLTVTDVGGNTRSYTEPITVVGPSAPSGGSSGGSSSGAGSSTGSSGGSGSGSAGSTAVPAPVAAAAVVSRTLKSALHSGLAVRYSVNEQVAGRFEVLLSAATAKRLGISGTPATGLPVGSPAELVIAKAVLVTAAGGRSTVHIQFPKRTASRLGRVRKVSLTLRLIVRNAASKSPATTTVVSAVTLG